MDFDYSPKTKELQARLLKFMDEHIYPNEAAYHEEITANTAAGKRCKPLKTSSPRPRPLACGTYSCLWTVPKPPATTAPD